MNIEMIHANLSLVYFQQKKVVRVQMVSNVDDIPKNIWEILQ